MKTIRELNVKKTFYKRKKDSLGNWFKIPYEKSVPRKIILVVGIIRLLHFLIDFIIVVLISFVIIYLTKKFNFYILYPDFSVNIISTLVMFFYYFIFEKTLQQTIGKFITNSVVINQYAEPPSFTVVFIRTVTRFIPFEIFSCFSGRGWHDKLSNTYVVTKDEANKLKRLLEEKNEDLYISEDQHILD